MRLTLIRDKILLYTNLHFHALVLTNIYIYIYIYNSMSLDVVQSLYFGSKLPKYRDCATSNDFELYSMCCGVMLLLLIIYIYILTVHHHAHI